MKKLDEKLYPYELLIDVKTTSSRAKKQFGEWKSNTRFKVEGIKKLKESKDHSKYSHEYSETYSSVDLKDNDKCYLLFYSSDSGDSFGRAVNSRLEGAHTFKSLELAVMAGQRLLLDYNNDDDNYRAYNNSKAGGDYYVLYLQDNLKYGKISRYDYSDFFGGLNELNIYEMTVGQNIANKIYDKNKIENTLPEISKYLLKAREIDTTYEIMVEKNSLEKNLSCDTINNKLKKI